MPHSDLMKGYFGQREILENSQIELRWHYVRIQLWVYVVQVVIEDAQIHKLQNPQSNISTPYPNSWFMHYPNPDTWLGSEVGHGLGFVGRENIRLWIFVVCESSSTACVTQTHRCILPVTWCHRNSICNFKISRSPTFSPIKSECGMSIVYIATPHRKHQFQSF